MTMACVPVELDDPALRDRGVALWCVDLDAAREPPEEAVADLDDDERARLARVLRVGDRARFACLRAALRRCLGARLGLPARAVPIRIDSRGKPRLPDDSLWFSLAHSGDHGLVVVSATAPIGVDIEAARDLERLDALAEIILSAAERPIWLAERPERRPALFLRAWTAKEALLKASGAGLLDDPKALTVLAGGEALTVRGEKGSLGFDPGRAVLRTLPAPPGYAAALALIAPARSEAQTRVRTEYAHA